MQVWSLKSYLEAARHEVNVIDYRGDDFKQYELVISDSPKSLISSILFYRKNQARARAFENFIDEYLAPTERYGVDAAAAERMESLANEFDCFICGSDQIWNLDCTNGPVPAYFLDFAGDRRRIAYAPSLSHASFKPENFSVADRERIASWLARFRAVSVREASTAHIFQPLCPTKIETCLDPTLLLDAAGYGRIMVDVPDARGTLFVYMLEANQALIDYAGALARRMGLSVCYVSKKPLRFGVPARNYYGCGPREFLGLVRDADAVVTNSFHATVFSILFGTPFQTFGTQRSSSRMRELLDALDMGDRLVDGSAVAAPEPVDTARAAQLLAPMRASSEAFLADALGA